MKREMSTEFFLGALSLVLAVGLINMADLPAFFRDMAVTVGGSVLKDGLLFLFLAAYLLFFLSIAVSLAPVWRSVSDGTGTIPADRAVSLLAVALGSVLFAYMFIFYFAMTQLIAGHGRPPV